MTAHAMRGDRERLLDCGMDDYISKPISLDVLRRSIERAVPAVCDQDKSELTRSFDLDGYGERVVSGVGVGAVEGRRAADGEISGNRHGDIHGDDHGLADGDTAGSAVDERTGQDRFHKRFTNADGSAAFYGHGARWR